MWLASLPDTHSWLSCRAVWIECKLWRESVICNRSKVSIKEDEVNKGECVWFIHSIFNHSGIKPHLPIKLFNCIICS